MTDSFPEPPHAGQGAAFAQRRRTMVDEQLVRRGIRNQCVLRAMETVPRELFVPADLRDAAYEDGALPIGFDQTISQPYTVAFMCEAANPLAHERVLEIGTGCGYGAAVLGQLANRVDTLERLTELAEIAKRNLIAAGVDNVTVHVGDGTLGLPRHAPFDVIVVTAGATALPDAYVDQLADGGRIVIPIGPTRHGQTMCRFTRRGSQLDKDCLGGFAFVPLIGEGPAHPVDLDDDDGFFR